MPQTRRSKKQRGSANTAKNRNQRKTLSVSDIRNRFKEMDKNVRSFINNKRMNSPSTLGKHVSRQWNALFDKPLSSNAAKSLAQHYMNLHGKKKGGSAPLDYVMRPGLPAVASYATFPTEVGADPKSVQDLDVYYNNPLGRSCNIGTVQAKLPVDMGSNLVSQPVVLPPVKGGAFSATYSANQQIIRAHGGKRKTKRNTRRNKIGGDLMTSLQTRPYIASNPSGLLQRSTESWYGQPSNPSDFSDPSIQKWQPNVHSLFDTKLPNQPSLISGESTLLSSGLYVPSAKSM
jgi:hypothetical protein